MIKKISSNSIKLIKYYKFINHNLIYNNRAINRYKKDNFEISEDKADNLTRLKKSISNLKNCELKKQASNIVFSDGNPKSRIMFVGEAPGSNEDQEGLPFVGRAGTLLDKMLASINLDRKTEEFDFNQDSNLDFEQEYRSPGWERFKKSKALYGDL